MKPLSSLLLVHFLYLLSAAGLSALPLRFLAWDDEVAARKLAVVQGENLSNIEELHSLQRSLEVTAVPGEKGLKVRALDRKDPEGKPVDFLVKVADGMTRPLVLLLPDSREASGLRGLAIEDSSASFPWGTFRIVNATGSILGMALGTERKVLPADWSPTDIRPSGTDPLPVVIVSSAAPGRTPGQTLYSAVWEPDADQRRLIILAPGTDPRHGPLSLKSIPEDRRAERKTETSAR